ncbi:hypothetical protein DAPPUDRAFT_119364 [Daphnia pulex]|uniref:Uncharacterized protein n=1 Tax=Daphnia pulex TaxID=6669 RepID=E9HYB1_DAPPU|nr:hypothetical protein DAPPUDRAFT_119364 [Daphnia pulex]|eukprot:EFX63267.1 hypothetical protein DAPPUDRAFT_119364 [Daphnia pulex]
MPNSDLLVASPPVSLSPQLVVRDGIPNSEFQRIEDRRRSNLLRGVQLKTRHEKFKKNRQNAEAALERSKRNEAWAKKELASFRSKMCKDEAEAQRMFGDVI